MPAGLISYVWTRTNRQSCKVCTCIGFGTYNTTQDEKQSKIMPIHCIIVIINSLFTHYGWPPSTHHPQTFILTITIIIQSGSIVRPQPWQQYSVGSSEFIKNIATGGGDPVSWSSDHWQKIVPSTTVCLSVTCHKGLLMVRFGLPPRNCSKT